MDWLEAAFGFGDQAQPAVTPAEPPRPAAVMQSCWCVVRQPSCEGDLGETIPCQFFVDDGWVTLCDENGKPTEHERRLAPGDDPDAAAKRMQRQVWRQERSASEMVAGFGRPLRYVPMSIA